MPSKKYIKQSKRAVSFRKAKKNKKVFNRQKKSRVSALAPLLTVKSSSVEKPKTAEPLQPPRGMRDILPADQVFWDAIKIKAEELANAFGYGYIETPILEHKSLFVRSVGEGTDIVQKEMYSFKDQGGDELVLRPEGTAAVARAYVNHGMLNLPQPVKLWYQGQFFRRERPQSGRSRQFHQWCVEVLGDVHPVLDAEVISIAMSFFQDLGLPVNLEINSIGCQVCRATYKKELLSFYKPKQELLCGACNARMDNNPLRMLDCKETQCELLREGSPQIVDFLCEACRDHFMHVLEYLDDLSISYNLNSYLVRGLDYYTKTVFEIFPNLEVGDSQTKAGTDITDNSHETGSLDKPAGAGDNVQNDDWRAKADHSLAARTEPDSDVGAHSALKAQSALAGGGRYDGLIEQLGGRPTPGVGFSIGMERVVSFMRCNPKSLGVTQSPRVFIAQLGEGARRRAFLLWHNLRKHLPSVVALSKDGLKAQLEIANRLQVRYVIIIGQKEILDNTAIIRDMEAGIQEVVDYNKVITEIKKKLG